MLTNKYRPSKFSEVIGQDMAVSILKAMVKNPGRSPKSILLHGEWGTGKTTMARLLGKALSCENYKGDVCGVCDSCRSFGNVRGNYLEFDSSTTGNVKSIQGLKSSIDHVTDGYRVIVFDEIHVASSKAQSALLKLIEEGPLNTFFVFCTTELDKVLKTIQSRSLPVEFFGVSLDILVGMLRDICDKEGFDISDSILEKIALKSDGHVRDALMSLDGYSLSGDDGLVELPVDLVRDFFNSLVSGDSDVAKGIIEKLMKFPVGQVHRAMNFVVMKMVENFSLGGESEYRRIVKMYDKQVFNILKLVSSSWVQEAFKDEYLAYSFLLTLLKKGLIVR